MGRALVVSPTPSHPADHGHRNRVRQTCAFLADAGFAIDFVLYPMDADFADAIPAATAEMAACWGGLCCIVPPSRPLHTPAAGLDHALDEWWDPALDAQLAWLTRRRAYEVMWVNYAFLSRAFLHAPGGCLRVLDTHDRLSGRRALFERHGVRAEFFHLDEATEAQALARADIVVAIKAAEAAHFARLGAAAVVTLPAALPAVPASVAAGAAAPASVATAPAAVPAVPVASPASTAAVPASTAALPTAFATAPVAVPASTAAVPASTAAVPAAPVAVPAVPVASPASTAAVPASTAAVPASTAAVPAAPAAVPAVPVASPASTAALPATTAAVPASTAALPAATAAVPASTAAVPASTAAVPASTAAVPASTAAVPASTAAVPKVPVALPASTVALPASTVALPASNAALPGAPTAVASAPRPRGGPLRIGFIGADNQVNAASLTAFLRRWEAWCDVWLPDAEIVVAGEICRHVAVVPGRVSTLGRVEHAATFYRAVDVVVAPTLFSTGMKVKLAEALAWRMPFVATADACDGFAAHDPFHALPDLDAVCAALATLAAEPERLARLAAATAPVAAAIEAEAAAGMRSLRLAFAARRRRIAVVTDVAFDLRRTLGEERAWQAVAFLAALLPVSVLCVGRAPAGRLPPRTTARRAEAGAIDAELAVETALAACFVSLERPLAVSPPDGVATVRDDWFAWVRTGAAGTREIALDCGTRLAATPLRFLPPCLDWSAPPATRHLLLAIVEGAEPDGVVAALRRACPMRLAVLRTPSVARDPALLETLAALPAPFAIATVGAGALTRELVAALADWGGAACFHLAGEDYPLLLGGRLLGNVAAHVAAIGAWLRGGLPPLGSERAPDAGWSVVWRRLHQRARAVTIPDTDRAAEAPGPTLGGGDERGAAAGGR